MWHVKAMSYITLGVFLKDGIRKRNGNNFYLKYYALKHNIQYKGQWRRFGSTELGDHNNPNI